MTEEKKLQLNLEEGDARVLAAALSILPLILDGKSLDKLLSTIDDLDHRMLVVMTAAMLAGAKHVSKIEAEMSDNALRNNVARGKVLMETLCDWLEGRKSKHGMDH